VDNPSWPSAVVAVAFIALVGLMFYVAVDHDFATIWAGVGTVVGVVTGAIPSYFFHAEAKKANAQTQALLAASPPGLEEAARKANPRAFR
jgi:hypothetical protein